MKLRNYEKTTGIIYLTTIFFITITILIVYTYLYKINSYYLIKGVVFKDDLIEILVSEKEQKIINQNSALYINNKKNKYKIKNVISNALVKEKTNYNIIYLECSLEAEKENDIIDLVFLKERIKLYEIFKLIWNGG